MKTPISNLSVAGTLKLDGDAAINGNTVIAGAIVLGQTHITEEIFNELVYAANQPGLPGPQGDSGPPGEPGPSAPMAVPERDNIPTSIMGFGNKGEVAFGSQDGNIYLYVCYQAGNWGRILLDTNF
jgi:hypothetical protein